MSTIENITEFSFPNFKDKLGELTVYEGNKNIPYNISRIFVVSSSEGKKRGSHAHIACSQLIVCMTGKCLIKCDDGNQSKEFILDKSSQGILIPPMIWAEQVYLEDNSNIMVICDRPYEEDDYIKEYQKFLSCRLEQQ